MLEMLLVGESQEPEVEEAVAPVATVLSTRMLFTWYVKAPLRTSDTLTSLTSNAVVLSM